MEITKVFVVIVTYNGHQWYDRCFQSLRHSLIPVQTIVVDNASTDGSVDYINDKYKEVYTIPLPRNIGFGQANNRGIRYALNQGCDYVFLLNQDAWVEENTISRLVGFHQNNKEYGILSPIHLTPDWNCIEKGLLTYLDDFKTTDRTLFEDLYFNRIKDIYESSYINAAAWLLPRKTLTTVGGFDPIFFQYGEDDNYIRRVIYHGFKIGICPMARMVHDCDNRGVRVFSAEETERRRLLPLLVRFTDITLDTSNANFRSYLLFLCRKRLVSFLRGQKRLSENYKNNYCFLKRNKQRIAFSVEMNKKIGETWL